MCILKSQRDLRRSRRVLHAIGTPLTSAMFVLETLVGQVEKKQNKRAAMSDLTAFREQLDSVHTQLDQVFSLLADYARDASVAPSQIFSPYQEIVKITKEFSKPYGVNCQINVNRKIKRGLKLYGPTQDFRQIITHLLNNAAESYYAASANREIVIDINYTMKSLVISISDHGRGLNLIQLFAWHYLSKTMHLPFPFSLSFPLSSLAPLSQRKHFVSDLGLREVQRLLTDSFNGDLQFTSRLHLGTCAQVIFPVG